MNKPKRPLQAVPLATPPDRRVILHPGDVASGVQGDRFETLLGSCVAVVLTDRRRTVGAMCHIVHTSSSTPGSPRSAAWGDVALDLMYAHLLNFGAIPQQCVAYVYGGGNMFPDVMPPGARHVGSANGQWVLDALAADGITVIHHDLGGNRYRRLSWVVGHYEPHVIAVPV